MQELSTHAILDANNCVVLAPTVGGKTEASFFPPLSAMDAEDWRPVSVLHLSPIRALLNNQEQRVGHYAEMLGRRAFEWHGDTTQDQRKRFIAAPADILLTTPESLEAMLMSARVRWRSRWAAWWGWVSGGSAFRDLTDAHRAAMVQHMAFRNPIQGRLRPVDIGVPLVRDTRRPPSSHRGGR